ncbi:hypothetical protein GQ53DRAFT_745264 [Thozetella sp. PMI_491]|nr:hypothetical protein GQ53DRAFT_745264 [Thozetella sp. PMI_491]
MLQWSDTKASGSISAHSHSRLEPWSSRRFSLVWTHHPPAALAAFSPSRAPGFHDQHPLAPTHRDH